MVVDRGLAAFGSMWQACLKKRSMHGLSVAAPGWDLALVALVARGALSLGCGLRAFLRRLAREALCGCSSALCAL
jgi:hypothetical protein